MKNVLKNPFFLLSILLAILIVGGTALANPQFFSTRVAINGSTSTTTGSVAYMTPGTGTTTLTIDTWRSGSGTSTNIFENNKLTGLSLFIQMHASSTRNNPTTTLLNWRIEYSNNDDDWYQEFVYDHNDLATSTVLSKGFREYQMTVASTSPEPLSGSTAMDVTNGVRDHKVVKIPVLSRYVRAIFYLGYRPNTNQRNGLNKNGGVWAEFTPVRESSN